MANMVTLLVATGAALTVISLAVRREGIWSEIKEAISWLRGNRTVVVGLAILLVAVPTWAALFPGLVNRMQRGWRLGIMGGWLAVAALATFASQSRESAVHAMTKASQRIVLRHYLAVLLGPQTGVPTHYRFSVYLIDQDDELLLPWYPNQSVDPDDPTVFRVGQGATGCAYERHELVCAVGDAVSSNEFGLSPAQQHLFAPDQVVAAVPIRLLSDEVTGTLSVISHTNDGYFVSEGEEIRPEGVRILEDLADRIGDLLSEEGIQWEA